jgi:hypothetical protein
MEKEKLKLSLKHVPSRRLPKVLAWLLKLLDRVPRGEQLARQLAAQLPQLLDTDSSSSCGSAAVRLELHNMQERISSLRAGLLTWQDHLKRVQQLLAEAEQLAADSAAVMEAPRQLVDADLPSRMEAVHDELLRSKVSQNPNPNTYLLYAQRGQKSPPPSISCVHGRQFSLSGITRNCISVLKDKEGDREITATSHELPPPTDRALRIFGQDIRKF